MVEENKSENWKKSTRGRDQWDKLPTLADDDDEVTAKKHWE